MQSSTLEEASLQSKIQAMKNLLQIQDKRIFSDEKSHSINRNRSTERSLMGFRRNQSIKHHGQFSRNHAVYQAKTSNRTWSRFGLIINKGNKFTHSGSFEMKKPMWNKGASSKHFLNFSNKNLRSISSNSKKKASCNTMEKLQLDGSVYAKRNGGFSLIRSGGPSHIFPSNVSQARLLPTNNFKLPLRSRPYTKDNVIRRSRVVSFKQSYARVAPYFKHKPIGATRHVAQAAVDRARLAKAKQTLVRTEYCLFYNRFGCCNKKNSCKYIHDSRKIAVCPKFLKGGCDNPKCLLSHKHDQNKMPVCKLFLRGTCTREGCKYRHIKVSSNAGICPAFLKGYCPLQSECCLKHELPTKKRTLRSISNGKFSAAKNSESMEGTTGTSAGHLDTFTHSEHAGCDSKDCKVSTATSFLVEKSTIKNKESPSGLVIRPNLEMAAKRQKVELFPLALREQHQSR